MAEDVSSGSARVLLVDDDPDVLTAAQVLLRRNGYAVVTASSPAEAWSVLAADPVDLILLDLNFSRGATSGEEGFRWLEDLRAHDPEAVVVVVTGHSGINIAVAAMKAGASDFVMKPWSNARLLDTVRDAVALGRRRTAGEAGAVLDEGVMIGDSPAFRAARDLLHRAAPTAASVLLLGPAGVGKSLAARLLHERSGRGGPMVRLDARALPQEGPQPALLAAVQQAAGGTLVLDEAPALSPAAQATLAAILEDGIAARLVSTAREAPADLRDDLLAELGTVQVDLPPLAARGEDRVLLAEHFVRLFSRRHGKVPKPLDPSALSFLEAQPPTGEIRGLRQAVERAVVLSVEDVLTAADFQPTASPSRGSASGGDLNLARSERAIVEAALKRHAHNVSQAARELGLTRAALYRRMVKHGL